MGAGRAALAVSVIALVAAIAGVAGALPGHNSVRSDDIRRDAVRAPDIRKGAVRSAEIRGDAVHSAEIRDKAVTEPDLADDVALETLAARRVRMTIGDLPFSLLEAGLIGLESRCVDNGGSPEARVYVETETEGSVYGPSSTPAFGQFTPLADRLLIANDSSTPSIETTPYVLNEPGGPTISGVAAAGVQIQGRDCFFSAYGVQGPGFSGF